ncbi:unnamed protein product [Didymodactylos carnosus]|uniref:F-box domain-containing protein n=1 Tax=Didymodactylos carnosus TaxID=1234261 RepID=A0A814WE28_9BILA|nr:unnamed protein product [Didymodactylos carnosus]CAF1201016.1 unnamed protein product [Didymodactylos carnosus]CAF3774890.1 unnamed protein product [Didymodactylos carnosus]CAF3965485.1 unnamed protein product [Didymodactylos carnosus]
MTATDALNSFRSTWQKELHNGRTNNEPSQEQQEEKNELTLLSGKRPLFKNNDIETIEPIYHDDSDYFHQKTEIPSFTIGINSFHVDHSSQPIRKKTKTLDNQISSTTTTTIIDQLIQDINETYNQIPFFDCQLPREIALKIFNYLTMKDLCICSHVSRSWNSLASDELLWEKTFYRLGLTITEHTIDDSFANMSYWKRLVRQKILESRQLVSNWKNKQCSIKKLKNGLGIVLTCATNNDVSIVGGYSSGIIKKWKMETILSQDYILNDENEYENDTITPEIIYETSEFVDDETESSAIRCLGLMNQSTFALHENGTMEIWSTERGGKPYYVNTFRNVENYSHDETLFAFTTRSTLHVLKEQQHDELHQSESNVNDYNSKDIQPHFQQIDFENDHIISLSISNQHLMPFSILATKKALWCVSLKNIQHRLSFYTLLLPDFMNTLPLDIHSEETLAVVGVMDYSCAYSLKLFDLQSGRCDLLSTYENLPSGIKMIRARNCPRNEFIVAYNNYQLTVYDQRLKMNNNGGVQHFYGHYAPITGLQMDEWRLAGTDDYGFIKLWDRRMDNRSLWFIHPQSHPITHCYFDKRILICASTPYYKYPDMTLYRQNSEILCGHIYVYDFKTDLSTKDAPEICQSNYDVPEASNHRLQLATPFDRID